jgi:hypothetical protein
MEASKTDVLFALGGLTVALPQCQLVLPQLLELPGESQQRG